MNVARYMIKFIENEKYEQTRVYTYDIDVFLKNFKTRHKNARIIDYQIM